LFIFNLNKKESKMNEDRIKGQWKQLAGKIKERYGIAHDEARKQVKKFHDSL